MSFWIVTFLFILIGLPSHLKAEVDISESLRRSLSVQVNPQLDFCVAEAKACPPVIQESLKDLYRKGTAGTINTFVSDGSLKNPRTVCDVSAEQLKRVNPSRFNHQLLTYYQRTPQLSEYTEECFKDIEQYIDDEHKSKDKTLAYAYMQYDFNYKSLALDTAMKNLLDSQAQISLIIPDNPIDCRDLRLPSVKSHCQEMKSCRRRGDYQHYLDEKNEEVSQVLNAYMIMASELKKHNGNAGRGGNRQKAQEIREDMDRLIALNPLLKGEKFKGILNNIKTQAMLGRPQLPQKAVVDEAIKGQLKLSQREIRKQMKEFNGAYKCLVGEATECDGFEDSIKKTNYIQRDQTFPYASDLNQVSSFHQCIENIKDARNQADEVLDDVAINMALTLTPYAIVNGVKLAGTLARTAAITSRVTQAERFVGQAALAGNLGYGGYYNIEQFNKCQDEVKQFENLGKKQPRLSCDSLEKIFVNTSNNTRCITQALISTVLMTPVAGNTLRLARHLPKMAPDKLRNLVSKIRSGKSLSVEEERLLLSRLRDKNPLDKLMVRGISPADKEFAAKAMERLYRQENLSPEELLRLSKLIKERNPPILVVTRQDNVDDILESNRIWGSTEGSVYGATKPAETAWDRFRTGVHGEKEGTFIFTPEAAALFQPHEVTGLYSGIKRAAGQYKGPFGDIIIEDFKKVMIDGRPHIVVTKARRAAGTGEEMLHYGQTTTKAEARLMGRRVGIDTLATGTGALVTIQASSYFTGTSVSDILYDLLADEE